MTGKREQGREEDRERESVRQESEMDGWAGSFNAAWPRTRLEGDTRGHTSDGGEGRKWRGREERHKGETSKNEIKEVSTQPLEKENTT